MAAKAKQPAGESIPALTVHQWHRQWDGIDFEGPHRSKPAESFYLCSVNAVVLRKLCGIERRTTKGGRRRKADLGIQRRHDEERSEEISRFIEHGYPWSVLNKTQRKSSKFNDLKQPGWLPTAIVINIRTKSYNLGGNSVDERDLISVEEPSGGIARLQLPIGAADGAWEPKGLYPIEVIDGQHRLWAFDPDEGPSDFQFPVVAFVGLDRSWQAYLFWTINIKPKKINASLAFDLYPLLRHQKWLERFAGPPVYRETRAQELTELMWAHEASPWHNRINMLGERGKRDVRQSAWVRALFDIFIRSYEGGRVKIGGLFGAPAGEDEEVLDWNREQQAAYLIYAWQQVERSVTASKAPWTLLLRRLAQREAEEEDATKAQVEAARKAAPFAGPFTLLNTDQGLRGILYLANDLAYLAADELRLAEWRAPDASDSSDEGAVSEQLKALKKEPVADLLAEIAQAIADFDWRTSATPAMSDEDRRRASVFRGSAGYREMRLQLHEHIAEAGEGRASGLAAGAVKLLMRS